MITGLYAGLAGLMLIYLSIRVIGVRRQTRISVGTADNADLERAMRVQGNFVEYTPLSLLLILVIELMGFYALALHGFGIALILARLIHFLGFRSAEAPAILRMLGMVLTFTLLLALAATAIVLGLGVDVAG